MKSIAEIVAHREPTEDERENLVAVLEIARAWEAGQLPLAGVRSSCSGHDRWRAMRFAGVGNAEKHLLMRLADALVADIGDVIAKHGLFTQEDLQDAGALIHADFYGRRIIRFKGLHPETKEPYYRSIPDYKLEEGQR
jgi:hypothetical protein